MEWSHIKQALNNPHLLRNSHERQDAEQSRADFSSLCRDEDFPFFVFVLGLSRRRHPVRTGGCRLRKGTTDRAREKWAVHRHGPPENSYKLTAQNIPSMSQSQSSPSQQFRLVLALQPIHMCWPRVLDAITSNNDVPIANSRQLVLAHPHLDFKIVWNE